MYPVDLVYVHETHFAIRGVKPVMIGAASVRKLCEVLIEDSKRIEVDGWWVRRHGIYREWDEPNRH